jgi:hypothetical protein
VITILKFFGTLPILRHTYKLFQHDQGGGKCWGVGTSGNVDLAPNKINTLCHFCAMYIYFVGHRNSKQKGPFKVGVYQRNALPQDHFQDIIVNDYSIYKIICGKILKTRSSHTS